MRLCRTGKHGDTMRDGIPIFFSSCGKENGHSWSKEKTLRDELTGEAANSPIRRSSRYGLPPKSGNLLPAALKVRKEPSASPHLEAGYLPGCKPERLSATVPCVPLRYALPGPTPGGVSKGEGPQSRPFVPRGGMGDGWRPPCFGWGSKGEGPLR